MTEYKAPGRGKLSAKLDRIPAAEVKEQPTTEKKTGIEIIREKWQRTADHEPEARVVVRDHDNDAYLWSGTPEQFSALKRALGKE